MVYILMGVAGCGKSSVGKMLSEELLKPFFDADSFHSPKNIARMKNAETLSSTDRAPWLLSLNQKIREWNKAGGAVLACSALKESYRRILAKGNDVCFIFLDGEKELIAQRVSSRKGHFFSEKLLQPQFDILEKPAYGMKVSIAHSVEEICQEILNRLENADGKQK